MSSPTPTIQVYFVTGVKLKPSLLTLALDSNCREDRHGWPCLPRCAT